MIRLLCSSIRLNSERSDENTIVSRGMELHTVAVVSFQLDLTTQELRTSEKIVRLCVGMCVCRFSWCVDGDGETHWDIIKKMDV